jgi:hypothetical protein
MAKLPIAKGTPSFPDFHFDKNAVYSKRSSKIVEVTRNLSTSDALG